MNKTDAAIKLAELLNGSADIPFVSHNDILESLDGKKGLTADQIREYLRIFCEVTKVICPLVTGGCDCER